MCRKKQSYLRNPPNGTASRMLAAPVMGILLFTTRCPESSVKFLRFLLRLSALKQIADLIGTGRVDGCFANLDVLYLTFLVHNKAGPGTVA